MLKLSMNFHLQTFYLNRSIAKRDVPVFLNKTNILYREKEGRSKDFTARGRGDVKTPTQSVFHVLVPGF